MLRISKFCSRVHVKKSVMFGVWGRNNYHSYPDPNEKAVITFSKSDTLKSFDKHGADFVKLNASHKMDTIFPGTPLSNGISKSSPPPTVSTILPNGLTVATQEMPGLMSSFALLVRTGSSYETQKGPEDNSGCTHFLEMNGFRSTTNREHMQLISEIEELGGMVQCLSTRENIIYCVDVLRANTEKAMEILADSVLRPLFPESELEESRAIVQLQRDELPAEVISRDLVQMAAYKGYPLGNTHFCPLDKLSSVNEQTLHAFRSKYFVGSNCIISAAGVDHSEFVRMVEKNFSDLVPGDRLQLEQGRAVSEFTGGLVSEQRTLKEPFVKIAMAFEVGGWDDPMLVATCVLQQLLGGGSSFSAGGPGKGMYTRLYTQVLNRSYWTESIEAFVSIHEKKGLFGIDAACPPEHLSNMIRVMAEQFTLLALVPVSEEELSRAKNMLKSMMMMQLESRLVTCEDIGRQFITYGRRDLSATVCDKIDAVTAADLMAVGDRMMQLPPAISCVGHDISHMPAYEDICTYLQNFRHEAWKKIKSTK